MTFSVDAVLLYLIGRFDVDSNPRRDLSERERHCAVTIETILRENSDEVWGSMSVDGGSEAADVQVRDDDIEVVENQDEVLAEPQCSSWRPIELSFSPERMLRIWSFCQQKKDQKGSRGGSASSIRNSEP